MKGVKEIFNAHAQGTIETGEQDQEADQTLFPVRKQVFIWLFFYPTIVTFVSIVGLLLNYSLYVNILLVQR